MNYLVLVGASIFIFSQATFAKNLIIPDGVLANSTKINVQNKLSNESVKADIDSLIEAIQKGYSGMYVYGEQLNNEIFPDLRKIKAASTRDLCLKIGKVLEKVDDYHLRASTPDRKNCSNEVSRKAIVGSNLQKDNRLPWSYSEKIKDKKHVSIFSIVRGELGDSKLWNGFLDNAKLAFKTADVVIVDIRGNRGGDDSKFREFAQIFLNIDDKEVNLRQGVRVLQRQSPEAIAMMMNSIKYYGKELGDTSATEKSFSKLYEASQTGLLSEYGFNPTRTPVLNQNNIFKGEIIILTDRHCASSCESIVEYFNLFPRTKRVGDNTAGMVSFGNLGTVYLENSHIFVGLSTQIYEYSNGQKIERVGFPPDLRLREGQDAFVEAMKTI